MATCDPELATKIAILSVLVEPQQSYMYDMLDRTSSDAAEKMWVQGSVTSDSAFTSGSPPHLAAMINGELEGAFLAK
eukprot:7826846-Pyramimonas_sp.AAC.1